MLKRYFTIIVSIILLPNLLHGQCSILISNLPDTILACKNTSIQLTPTLTASGVPNYIDTFWTPATGLSDPNILNPFVNVGTTSQNYVLTVQAVTASELITNGDFSMGDAVFSSSYIYGTGGSFGVLSAAGQYAITTNPSLVHNNFVSFGDHTTGTGNMMVVNGAASSNIAVWCQTISVNPNTWYDFSAWGATCIGPNPAVLQFSINTTLIGTSLSLPLATGQWTQFHATWFSGSNTSINICINDQQILNNGNDFALDDISFKEICTVQDSVYVKTVNLTPSIQPELHLGCDEDSVKFYAQNGGGDIPTSFAWNFGDGTVSTDKDPLHIFASQGIYAVKLVVDKNGCKDSFTYNIDLTHSFDVNFFSPQKKCVGELVNTIDISPNPVNTTIVDSMWYWGDGLSDKSGQHTYFTPGTYTILYVKTDIVGCKDSFQRNIIIEQSPFVSFTATDINICIGQSISFSDSTNYCDKITWNFGDGNTLINFHNPSHVFDQTGNFVVTLIGENNICLNNVPKTLNISVNPYPQVNLGNDTAICSGLTGSILLTNNIPTTGSYLWNTGEITNSILVNTPGHYWMQVANGDCATTDSVWVKNDCYLNIPNSFSPNGDGMNDYFLPREILSSGLMVFKMSIYNRWGQKIYYTDKLNGRGWDGKYNSKLQELDTYIYIIDAVFENGLRKNFKGNVTLLK